MSLYSYVGGNPVNFTDPTGEYGLPGAIIGAGLNAWIQFGANFYISGDFYQSVRCIDLGDVAISGFLGFIGPGFIPAAGPGGLTAGQNSYIYFTKVLPASFAFKRLSPRTGYGDDCECAGLSLGNALGQLVQ